jgi:hypothetical protein
MTMKLIEILEAYFAGEKLEALLFILPLGVVSLVFGASLLFLTKDAFARGVAIPCLVLGLALAATGGAVGVRTSSQVATLKAAYAAEPEAMRAAEAARMKKVNANWPIYLTCWVAFAIAGLILRFGPKSDMAQGIGTALVFFAGVGLLIDGFAERRARPYTEALTAPAAQESK